MNPSPSPTGPTGATGPVGPRDGTIPVEGGRLRAREIGEGRPIVVLHGGPDFDYEYLLPEMDRLADLGRVIYYAQRGRGHSYAGEEPDDISVDGEMADLDAVRAWAGEDRIAVIGHSFGTLLALEYATRHSERVSHLVLMNPAPASHADVLVLRRHFARIRSPDEQERLATLAADPAYLAGNPAIEAERYAIHFAAAFHEPANLDVILGRLRRSFTPEAIVAARAIEDRLYEQTWARDSYDLLPRLHGLHAQTLVLHGDHDFVPFEIARRIADAVPGSRMVDLPACGHFAYLEQPEAVHRAIAELLA